MKRIAVWPRLLYNRGNQMKISRSRVVVKTVKLTEQQEKRLSKLYSILEMINPVESSQNQPDNDGEKTVVLAEANPN